MDAPAPLVHLDVRSCFSLKEGAFTPEQLARAAAAQGMPAVALTDRDGLYGAARFVAACAKEGITPILGASLTVRAPGGRGREWWAGKRTRHACRPARHRRRRVREPLPADHRRAHAGDPRRPLGGTGTDLRARRRPRRAPRPAVAPGPARHRRPRRRGRARGRTVPRGVRTRAPVRRRRASRRGPFRRGGPRDAPARRTPGRARRRHERRALPRARGRVRRRRPRVHAPDRAGGRQPRDARERRGLAEAGTT